MTPSRLMAVGVCALAALASLAACARGGLRDNLAPPLPPAPAASASPPAECPACTVDATHYLRQLSLDLRGRPPSYEELAEAQREGQVSPATIDAWLRSDELLAQVKAWHKALLWPNLDGFHVRGSPLIAFDFDEKTGKRKGGAFSPDPALLDDGPPPRGVPAAKRPRPHGFVFLGDGNTEPPLRGGNGIDGCDPSLEYPPPAAKGPQPIYAVAGPDKKKRSYPYYDADGVPLPYHDAAHCPNYCSSKTDEERTAPGYKQKIELYARMNEPGADAAPHELDPAGFHCPASHPYRVVNTCTNAVMPRDPEGRLRERREGYRRMKHYWSGATEIRTCAYEAQERTQSALTGAPCAGQTLRDPSCGCGPNGTYCMPTLGLSSTLASRAEHLVRAALNEEPLEIVASVVARDEDYFTIFTTRRSFITGPLAFLYKNQLPAVEGLALGLPARPEALPSLPYEDLSFHEFVRDPEHAGVLTTPAYLGRFPTWRARVSQFRTAFMCRPFTPGSAALPAPDDPCSREPNLGRRCGCKGCHSAIEPMSAWFGRWAERSAKYLSPAEYPAFDPACQQCAITGQSCTARCRTQYVTETVDADSARFAGTLRGVLYRTEEEQRRIDEGPGGLVESAIASGELSRCAVQTAWGRLLGRPMSENEVSLVLPSLVRRFDADHHNYRALVRAIVTSAAYRRAD